MLQQEATHMWQLSWAHPHNQIPRLNTRGHPSFSVCHGFGLPGYDSLFWAARK